MKKNNQLIVQHLSCLRQGKILFDPLSFSLSPGQTLFIQGPNGSGKSSLLRVLSGLATPHRGDIIWENPSRSLHFIGHVNGSKMNLSVLENLQLIIKLHHQTISCMTTVLDLLKLNNHQHTLVKNLSAGQKRRVALAKLFLFTTDVWILDEPLTALDTDMQNVFLAALKKHLQQGGMAIISSHHSLPINEMQMIRLGNAC